MAGAAGLRESVMLASLEAPMAIAVEYFAGPGPRLPRRPPFRAPAMENAGLEGLRESAIRLTCCWL